MQRLDDIGKLILRLALGVLILMHGLAKLMNGATGIIALVSANGWPAWIGYGVFIGEGLAPALIILGVITRLGGLAIAVNMTIAIYLAHSHQLFAIDKTGGWLLELQGIYLFCGLAVMLLGAGKFSLGGARGKLN